MLLGNSIVTILVTQHGKLWHRLIDWLAKKTLSKKRMKRLFFALWPSNETRKKIDLFSQSINSDNLKKVQTDNLHVTLVFLGNIDTNSEEIIRKNTDNINIQPFVLHFDQLAFWKKPKILCLLTHQYPLQLEALVEALKNLVEDCGINTEERPYNPHVTLARKAHKLIDIEPFLFEWQAHSFCLVESCSTDDGVKYQVIQQWELS